MPKRLPNLVLAVLSILLVGGSLIGCGGDGKSGDNELIIYSGRNQNLVDPILRRFATDTGIEVRIKYADTAQLASTLLEEGNRTRADVFFSQDAGALAALANEGLLSSLPDALLDQVDARFRDPKGRWVGVTARARVVAYNTNKLTAADLPASVFDFAAPAWSGRVGIAPTNASFVAYVSALIESEGRGRTKEFLEGLKANGAKTYDNNILILDAVANGDVDVGLTNHYYLYNEFSERPNAPVDNFFPGQQPGGEGTFVNVAGVGILADTDQREAAERFVRFLLSREGEEYFRDETKEYPLAGKVDPISELPPLDRLRTIDVPLDRLGRDLEASLELIKEVGLT